MAVRCCVLVVCWFGACCMLFDVRWLLCVVCLFCVVCLSRVVCLSSVARKWFAVCCCVLFVAGDVLFGV